jgi:prophage regulatory protein
MLTTTNHVPTSILRIKQVLDLTGLSRSTIYLRVKEGKFPQPITLGPRSVGWPSPAVDAWIQQTIAGSSWPLPAPNRKAVEPAR